MGPGDDGLSFLTAGAMASVPLILFFIALRRRHTLAWPLRKLALSIAGAGSLLIISAYRGMMHALELREVARLHADMMRSFARCAGHPRCNPYGITDAQPWPPGVPYAEWLTAIPALALVLLYVGLHLWLVNAEAKADVPSENP